MPRIVAVQGTDMGTPVHRQKSPSEGLTSIGRPIHCAATEDATEDATGDATEDGYSETDRIIIQNFLNTLAEIALAVASRRGRQENQ